jgi:hypothetical protein
MISTRRKGDKPLPRRTHTDKLTLGGFLEAALTELNLSILGLANPIEPAGN